MELGFSGGGSGVPGGGRGRPLPIGWSGVPALSGLVAPSAELFGSALRLMTPQPHFFAAAVALPKDEIDARLSKGARVRAIVCRVDDRLWPSLEPDLVEAPPVLVGVGGMEGSLEESARGATTVSCIFSSPFEEVEDQLLVLLLSVKVEVLDGEPMGVSIGEAGWDRLEIATMELTASLRAFSLLSFFGVSTFAGSVLTMGLAAVANERDRIALGG